MKRSTEYEQKMAEAFAAGKACNQELLAVLPTFQQKYFLSKI